jgi:uncharacterized protein with von Willebrand factor type A (vWA) domain
MLVEFLRSARRAGIAVSVAESIEAFAAVDLLGYDDRQTVKDALRLVIAKSDEERERFDECFERFFGIDLVGPAGVDLAFVFEPGEPLPPELEALLDSELARILLADDRAQLIRNLHAAAAGVDVASVRLFTQVNGLARRILEAMGIDALDAAIERLRGAASPQAEKLAEFLDARRRAVAELARDLVERRLAASGGGEADRMHDEFLRDARLVNVDRRDLERMRVLVRAMGRRLATRYGRTRTHAKRGHLDVRRTLRRSVGFDGVPFRTYWKRHKIQKPRVVLLCDVSGSCAPLAHFLLLFAYSLGEAFSDIRSFAFATTLIDVGETFEKESVDDAIAKIMRKIGFQSSDYGRALATFDKEYIGCIDRTTTVVVLGDGRTNYHNPRVDVLKRIYERARRVVWLNPEHRVAWGIDDSEMLRYLPYTHVARVCNRLRHLEEVVAELVKAR